MIGFEALSVVEAARWIVGGVDLLIRCFLTVFVVLWFFEVIVSLVSASRGVKL